MIASAGCDSLSHSHPRQLNRTTRSDSIVSLNDDSAPSSPDAPSFPRRDSGGGAGGNTKLSVSVVVHVNDNVGDGDLLDVTKYVWNRVSAAVGEGEVSVAVKRGWEGMEVS